MKKITLLLLLSALSFSGFSNKKASEIYLDALKFQSLKRVLYIAAHPDDENTRLLAFMSLGEHAETAYLSLTRGDGGQNLIGDELGDRLGVLRTQELLAARGYDGANQYFARALDFGYSKSADESFQKWGKDALLSDVVLIIRKFKPDVIITRFPPDKRGGHGHHTASAILAIEAFEKAADPDFLPKQVYKYGAWKTKSIYWNTSYWWMKDIADSAKKYPERYHSMDIGTYCTHLGMSYNEIGTLARSQHKCQGFGAVLERGSRIEYFEHLAGEVIEKDFFEKADRNWSLLVNADMERKIDAFVNSFNFLQPSKNVPALIEILKGLESAKKDQYNALLIQEKIERCKQLIIDCLGLYIEVTSPDYSFVSGEKVELNLSAYNRSDRAVELKSVSVNGKLEDLQKTLQPHEDLQHSFFEVYETQLTTPYWLENPYENLFVPSNPQLIGEAENRPTLEADVNLMIEGYEFRVMLPVEHVWRDPSYGERRRELICTPEFTANFDRDIFISKAGDQSTIKLKIHSFIEGKLDDVQLTVPKGWTISPTVLTLGDMKKHEEKWFDIQLASSSACENGHLELKYRGKESVYGLTEITYDHIPTQTILQPATLQCVMLNAKIKEGKIAYINGVKDAVPTAIKQLGFEVEEFEVADLANLDLSGYRSVVLGIRIYNVHPELFNYSDKLYQYVESGGNLVMQYNTASRAIREHAFGPKPFKLSRNRVTEEDAKVKLLDKKHPIFTSPNKITEADFENWVQERGLYFAGEWDEAYQPLISWNDQGEEPVLGGLIVMKHGKGQFVYTGISFFRELPKGVIGAYRLFANILSYESGE